MKRNLNVILRDLEGREMPATEPKYQRTKDGKVVFDEKTSEPVILEPAKPLTMRKVVMDAIGTGLEGDAAMAGEEKLKLYKLASRVVKACDAGEPVEFDSGELELLKQRICKAWPQIAVYGLACELLDADYVPPPAPAKSLLEECRDSGQVAADQIVDHQRAGELGGS